MLFLLAAVSHLELVCEIRGRVSSLNKTKKKSVQVPCHFIKPDATKTENANFFLHALFNYLDFYFSCDVSNAFRYPIVYQKLK